jgi:hypothetical protein
MKSGFQTALCTELKEGSDGIWIVTKPLKYWSELLNCLIVVPHWFETEGTNDFFETDYASVPRVPIVYEAWGNKAHREATLHDYLYRIDSNPLVTRKEADNVFLEAMLSTGKPKRIAYPMYWGVRLGGWTAYHKLKVKDKL